MSLAAGATCTPNTPDYRDGQSKEDPEEHTESADADAPLVLLVDDDADIRESFQVALEVGGFRAITATAPDALAGLRGGMRPRLILLDLMMPELGGVQFVTEQRRDPELAAIPVIMLSAAPSAPEIAASLGIECLKKPITLDDLLATVGKFCAPPDEEAG